MKSGKMRKRRLLPHHCEEFPWLGVSKVEGMEGAFCVPCVLFVGRGGVGGRSRGKGQLPGKLVTKPLTRFDDLTGKNGALSSHQDNEYHKENVLAMEHFRQTVIQCKTDIRGQLNESYRHEIQQNWDRLRPIIDTILTCSRQNIPLRGHRGELGAISIEGDEPVENDGNFRALLRFRLRSGDSLLMDHIKTSKANATYQSSSIQNELIRIAAPSDSGVWRLYEDTVMILDLISDIKSNNPGENEHSETRLSGKAIGETLLRKIRDLGLDLSLCVGQGYDGAGAMASERVGVSATIQNEAPLAFYFHCAMHCLNLSASAAIKVPPIRNAENVVREISTTFRASAKKTNLLKCLIESDSGISTTKKHLVTLCETRFVERHTAVVTFMELLKYTLDALSEIKCWALPNDRSKAESLEKSVCNSEFAVSLVILEKLSGLILPVSRVLQTVGGDLAQALASVNRLQSVLNEMRTEEEFCNLYQKAESVARDVMEVELRKPRIAARSSYRPNAETPENTTKDYYRVNFFYPAIDSIIADLEHRFGPHQQKIMKLNYLLPSCMEFAKHADVTGNFASDHGTGRKSLFKNGANSHSNPVDYDGSPTGGTYTSSNTQNPLSRRRIYHQPICNNLSTADEF
ncbi:52 kDa repressor of the inhibitor of the protein kinase [Holothuria leucospilota]|uniref:52 kDa repressor of the inhibitor of the protein kinase n=1 Tax=Holothuria leucospilota TaxID=206669 RepID=A0A9Q1BYL6_HOLLE|nr:52 kDa repressor of the inhibitor of the protein kinase [Holothuria leucospilota]